MSLSKQALELYHRNRNRVSEYMKNTRFDPEQEPPAYLGELSVLRENELSLQSSCTELEKEHSVKQSELTHLSDIIALLPMLLAECEALREKKAEAEHTLSLILLTKDILKEAKDDLSTRYLKNMELHFDRYYQKISEGVDAEMPEDNTRVTDYSIDTSLDISVVAYGEKRPVEVLSRGERDLVAFCARLSLMESIFTKEAPFLLLDDPFINLDDENYEKAAKLLASLSERFQIIYTVCSLTRLPKELPIKEL